MVSAFPVSDTTGVVCTDTLEPCGVAVAVPGTDALVAVDTKFVDAEGADAFGAFDTTAADGEGAEVPEPGATLAASVAGADAPEPDGTTTRLAFGPLP